MGDDFSRRGFLQLAAAGASGALLARCGSNDPLNAVSAGLFTTGDGANGTPFAVPRFVQPMPVPPIKQPRSIGTPPWPVGSVYHGVAPEWTNRTVAELPGVRYFEDRVPKFYEMDIRVGSEEIVPGYRTPIIGYDGRAPGPTFRFRVGEPAVVRMWNRLADLELSTHLHGGHNPAHSDGYPNFFVLPGRARDYYYSNTVPMLNGAPDFSESQSTMWYHDHAMDVAAMTTLAGLAGMAICMDEREESLVARNVLPAAEHDIPVLVQDKTFNSDGSIFYDPLDHDGYLGDVYVVNGKAHPYFEVERRKYRLRILNGCNARFLELRLSTGQPFLRLGKDSWLYPEAIAESRLLLAMANRADVIVDFTDAPDEVTLENILVQPDGRGPGGRVEDHEVRVPGVAVMQFRVRGPRRTDSATVTEGTPLRPHVPIRAAEVVRTRIFEFSRSRGAWVINGKFFDEGRADAVPRLGTAERWILRNNSGGWWHPVHIHLESHQEIRRNGGPPLADSRWKSDTCILGGGSEVEILMRFRTFRGPFVFHCHNLEHEDMRMMFVFDPRTGEGTFREPSPPQALFP